METCGQSARIMVERKIKPMEVFEDVLCKREL